MILPFTRCAPYHPNKAVVNLREIPTALSISFYCMIARLMMIKFTCNNTIVPYHALQVSSTNTIQDLNFSNDADRFNRLIDAINYGHLIRIQLTEFEIVIVTLYDTDGRPGRVRTLDSIPHKPKYRSLVEHFWYN